MSKSFRDVTLLFPVLAVLALVVTGCSSGTKKAASEKDPTKASPAAAKKEHDHSGWWCAEHGIPEAECSMCSSKVADAFKKKGDWCEKHDRAKSQCFICNPALKVKYAARYRAKYGKEPPPIEE
jgi:uncharacterized protein YceK